jgi:tetratricopeptide (TPR) repeat protein
LTTSERRGYFCFFLKAPIFLQQGVVTLAKAKGRASTQSLKHDPLMKQYLVTSAWARERSRPILKGSLIAVGAIAFIALVWWFFSNRAKNAADLMTRAMSVRQARVQNPLPTLAPGEYAYTTELEKHRAAYQAFTHAAIEYPSYNGDTGRYFAAIHQLHFEADKAEATLRELAQKDSDTGAQARMALAQRYEAVGKNDEAIAEYQKLKARPGPVPPALIDLSMARVYEAMGKTKEAVDLYFSIASNENLQSDEVGEAAADRLAALAPEKVDQLPAPKPTGPRFPGGGMPFN